MKRSGKSFRPCPKGVRWPSQLWLAVNFLPISRTSTANISGGWADRKPPDSAIMPRPSKNFGKTPPTNLRNWANLSAKASRNGFVPKRKTIKKRKIRPSRRKERRNKTEPLICNFRFGGLSLQFAVANRKIFLHGNFNPDFLAHHFVDG